MSGGIAACLVREVPVADRHDGVRRHQEVTLEPVRLPIHHHGHHYDHAERHHGGVQRAEVQVRGQAHPPAREDGEGRGEERDLRRGADRDANGEAQLVAHGEAHSRRVLARVADDREQHDADEVLAQVRALHDAVDRLHEELRGGGHQHGGREEERAGRADGELRLLLLLLVLVLLQGLPVGAELEDDVGHVGGADDRGGRAGDGQQPRGGAVGTARELPERLV